MAKLDVDIVDFHAHILPGADHGSDSVETTLGQLKLAKEWGVSRIVATPHFYPHRHTLNMFLNRRKHAYDALTSCLSGELPDVRIGAEVLVCEHIDKLEGLDELCISGTNVLLLELPFNDFSDKYRDSIEELISKGYTVVLAHADRYPKDNIDMLIASGAKIQLKADSLATLFKKPHLYEWAEQGHVVALGSDIHKKDKAAYKRFVTAKKKFSSFIDYIKRASDEMWNQATK